VQVLISREIWRGSGVFAVRRPGLGRSLSRFGEIDLAAIVLRDILVMIYYPDRRWFTGTVPIFFHFVLAGSSFVLGTYDFWVDRRQSRLPLGVRPLPHCGANFRVTANVRVTANQRTSHRQTRSGRTCETDAHRTT
jgi:hypothetical protein